MRYTAYFAAVLLICGSAFSQGSNRTMPTEIDYLMGTGSMEVDFDWNYRPDLVSDGWTLTNGSNWWNARLYLDYGMEYGFSYEGAGCQQIGFNRWVDGPATEHTIGTFPISVNSSLFPQSGEPMRLTYAMKGRNIVNVRYGVELSTTFANGTTAWTWLEQPNLTPGANWQMRQVDFAVPQGAVRIKINFKFLFNPGQVRGYVNLDAVKLTSGRGLPVAQPGTRALKLAKFYSNSVDHLQDAAMYDLFIVPHHAEAKLKALKPTAKFLFYALGWQSLELLDNVQRADIAHDLYSFGWARNNRPDWFLRDLNGAYITRPWGGYRVEYLMDYGDRNVRQFALDNLDAMIHNSFGSPNNYPDGVFFDNFSLPVYKQSTKYQTLQQRIAATADCIGHFRSHYHNKGMQVFANLSRGDTPNGPYTTIMPLLDGFMLEGFMVHAYDHSFHTPDRAAWHLRTVNFNPDKTAILMARRYASDPKRYDYVIAGMYLVNHENVYASLWADNAESRMELTPELNLSIGRPVGANYTIRDGAENTGALFMRTYEAGTVLVNTHPTRTFSYTPPTSVRDYRGRYYPANVPIAIGPNSGLILF